MSSHTFFDEGPPKTGKKILLATPSYDSPDATYTFSIARSREALAGAGLQTAYFLLQGNCHVDDARNLIVRRFRESDCDEMVFLDADVSWEPETLVQLCGRDYDIVGGVYSFRGGARANMPMRLMDTSFPDRDGMLELDGLPTGFLKIKREVFDKLEPHVPWYWDKTEKTPLFFARSIHEDNNRWGGDIEFCRKWRELGGRIWADTEIRLGHTGKVTYNDSLAAFLRRVNGITLKYLLPVIRDGQERFTDFNEIYEAIGNPFTADPEVMALVTGLARQCRGPIIETGSGITSLLMAAANPAIKITSLEHDHIWHMRTRQISEESGLELWNLDVRYAPLTGDCWYPFADIPQGKFALGFCDGPPRIYGTRMRFFDEIAPRCKVIVADDVGTDWRYARKVTEWCKDNGKSLELIGRAALIR